MKKYIDKYAVTNFDFYDLTAIIKKSWIIEFCDLIEKEGLNITWQLPSGTRSEAIDKDICKRLYRSGCRSMSYAPESGSVPELKRIKKKVDLDKMIDSMTGAVKEGIQIKTNFILGLPGMTWSDIFRTYRLIIKLAWIGVEDITAYPYSPYPGSELFNTLVDEGKITMNKEYFDSLSSYTDVKKGTSYNDTLGILGLTIVCLITMAYFYFFSCLFHPKRVVKIFYSILGIGTFSRLHMAILQWKKRRAIRTILMKQPEMAFDFSLRGDSTR